MNELDELALQYGTDKSSRYHGYTDAYDRRLGSMRPFVSRVLEIGVAKGLSLRMWRDYFPNATIVGVDSDLSTAIIDEPRIVTFLGNDIDPETAAHVGGWGPFDVVVDDGGHQMVEQKENFRLYFPHVRSGGVYVVEDLHTSYWPNYGGRRTDTVWPDGKLPPADTMVETLKGFVDSVNLRGAREYANHRGAAEAPDWEPPELERDIVSVEFCRGMCFLWKK